MDGFVLRGHVIGNIVYATLSPMSFRKILFISLLIPSTAAAHETWFVNLHSSIPIPDLFLKWGPLNFIFLLVFLALFFFALALHNHLQDSPLIVGVNRDLAKVEKWGIPLVRVLTGALLFTAGFLGFYFAPDLRSNFLPIITSQILLVSEMLIGLVLLLGVAPRLMAFLGLVLFIVLGRSFSLEQLIPYAVFLGIFGMLIITGDSTLPKIRGGKSWRAPVWISRFDRYALPLLRLGLALSLIFSALLFKIFMPQYGLEFVAMHPVNFVQGLGIPWFSDALFVLAAALVELLLGLLLFFNILPRLVAGILLIVFSLGVVSLGVMELLGHLPFFGAAYALLVSQQKRQRAK